ncbi:hypothetical protein ACQB60_43935 [Actinomycetota bacterium Odt1-20B]
MRGRALRAGLLVAGLATVLAGCGIRSTEVPTDFGPAPSRSACLLSGGGLAPKSSSAVPVQVYLVCGAQLVTVDRSVRIATDKPTTDRVRIAQALLDQLATSPSEAEEQAGFSTDVRGGTVVSGPRAGDPDDALRFSTRPEDLSSFALAQIVCTYASSAAADGDRSVVLGGPGDDPLERYECTPEVRARPGTEAPPSETVK